MPCWLFCSGWGVGEEKGGRGVGHVAAGSGRVGGE
jgi:hypothetical protein